MSIKGFTILAKLGEGAYSSVYKVERHADSTIYALKKVKLTGLSQKQIQNAVNEVRILASIKCPNIIAYKEAFLEGKNLCIVMEFADGGDLYQKILQYKKKKKYFEEDQIWNVLIQVTRALKMLHDLKIFHRDLKSANFFLTRHGQVKLGDMNVSKIAKNGLLYTQTGTPYYASPQVWKDQPYDSKSDIWSFGCVIYEMTTLQPPFKAEDMEGLFQAVTEGVYPPIPSIYSRQLSSVIKLMLQQNPANRPSTDKLLKSSLLLKKASELNIEEDGSGNSNLLRTIRIPNKLHYLTDRLPKSNYESIKSVDGIFPLNQRLATEKREGKERHSTLPKIEGLLRYHEQLIKKKERIKKYQNKSLQIEGISQSMSNDIRVQLQRKGKQEVRKEIQRIHHPKRQYNVNKHYYNHPRVLPPLRK